GAYSVVASPALAQGTYTAQARQGDAAGNIGTSAANTFTIDTTAPVVTLTTPANGSSINTTTPTFSGTAGTAIGDAATVMVTIYSGTGTGGAVVETLTAAVGSGGAYAVVASPALAEGTY